MRGARIVSLPILEDEKLAGIITVSDIAYSDMDVEENMVLSKAGTSYKNIVETIDGEMIVEYYIKKLYFFFFKQKTAYEIHR